MRRHEEILREDLQPSKWSNDTNDIANLPPIFRLPNEILLLVINLLWPLSQLKAIRYVSKRFARLAFLELFRSLSFKYRPVLPKTIALASLLQRYPSLGGRCQELQIRLRVCCYIIPQDKEMAQQDRIFTEILQHLPHLRCISITINPYYISNIRSPRRTSADWVNKYLPRLFSAFSQCRFMRCLEISVERPWHFQEISPLFFEILRVFTRTKCLRILDSTPLQLMDPPSSVLLPLFANVTHIYFCSISLLDLISASPTKFPALQSLECTMGGFKDIHDVGDVGDVVIMKTIESIAFSGYNHYPNRLIAVPTRRLEFNLDPGYYFSAVQQLQNAIETKMGVFRANWGLWGIVETIIIGTSGPGQNLVWDHPDLGDSTTRPSEPESLLTSVRDLCEQVGIQLETKIIQAAANW